VLGPALFSHVRCRRCDACYNGKTGNYNTTAIAVYTAVSIGAGLLILVGIVLSGFFAN